MNGYYGVQGNGLVQSNLLGHPVVTRECPVYAPMHVVLSSTGFDIVSGGLECNGHSCSEDQGGYNSRPLTEFFAGSSLLLLLHVFYQYSIQSHPTSTGFLLSSNDEMTSRSDLSIPNPEWEQFSAAVPIPEFVGTPTELRQKVQAMKAVTPYTEPVGHKTRDETFSGYQGGACRARIYSPDKPSQPAEIIA